MAETQEPASPPAQEAVTAEQGTQEEKAPLNGPGNNKKKDAKKSQLARAKETLKKSLCTTCGHEWHWTELFFLFMFCVGIGITIGLNSGKEFPAVLVVLFGALVAFVAFAYVWNMCPNRALALITEELAANVKRMNEQNSRALKSCDEMKQNNERFRGHLTTLDQSKKLIGKSAVSLDAAAKKQEELINQTSALVERRIKFGEELKDLLSSANKNSTRQAMVNLREMIMSELRWADLEVQNTIDSGKAKPGVSSHRQQALARSAAIQRVLKQENINWEDDIQDALMEEGVTHYEIYVLLERLLDQHFALLDANYQKIKELETELKALENLEKKRKQEYLEKKMILQEVDLNSFQRNPNASMDSSLQSVVNG